MSFSEEQIEAVRAAFDLAGYSGELRTLPVESDEDRVFIVPPASQIVMGDERSLELVLSRRLDREVLVTGDVGAPTVPFR